tara:strand:+ start:2519 stop:3442 length:924 start_codon:yes stop_codon:yes gene_type:complete
MKKYINIKKNKFGLIGLGGFIAERHLKVIKELSQDLVVCHDIIDSVGVIDRYFSNAKFEIIYKNYLNELKKNKVRFNVICSPNYLHFKHIVDTLRLGINVIVEKPPVLKKKQIDEISLLEKKFKAKCYVIFQLRFNKKLIQLKKQLVKASNNTLNKNKKFRVNLNYITSRGDWYKKSWKTNYTKSGGIIFNIGIHFFDIIFWIFGKPNKSKLNVKKETYCKGYIETDIANINWVLSTDKKYLPKNTKKNNQNFFREIKINNKVFEFSKTFENLHLDNYISILKKGKPDILSCNELIGFAEDINKNKK